MHKCTGTYFAGNPFALMDEHVFFCTIKIPMGFEIFQIFSCVFFNMNMLPIKVGTVADWSRALVQNHLK